MARTKSSIRGYLGKAVLVAAVLSSSTFADDVLETTGFSNCNSTAPITVQKVDIRFNNSNKTIAFDVAGSSTRIQNVTAVLEVTAYGEQIYSDSFDPCDSAMFIEQLCPVPAGAFTARGTQEIPAQFADLVPAIAFQVPDIASLAKLRLISSESNNAVACIEAEVSNGKTAEVPAVKYVAAGVAGAALVMTGVASASAAIAGGGMSLAGATGGLATAPGAAGAAAGGAGGGSGGGAGTISPSFTEVFGWMQGMAMNGMLSVNYPQVYRRFAQNFAFSTGLFPWTQMQMSIDEFRGATGGNLTADSISVLRNTTLVFPDGSTSTPTAVLKVKRAFEDLNYLARRQIETTFSDTVPENTDNIFEQASTTVRKAVSGISAYAEELSVPKANTFMTVLLIVSIVIAAIIVSLLLVKVILEFWSMFGNFPAALSGFRKHYWGSIGRAVTSLILVLYGVWTLYCVFQFTQGDSWAAKILAGLSLFLFSAVLGYFSWKIYSTAQRLKRNEGTTAALYEDKENWLKYSLFYESYKKQYWWIFIPTILYMFLKGFTLAAADGYGLFQSSAILVIEATMLIMLLWFRPFERRSGNIINICIQVVRVLSVLCILVFVEEFGIAQSTQTVTGVVLIAVQSALTGILGILIAWNAINHFCKENPHRKRRKELAKMQKGSDDDLTPLDARNSLLIDRKGSESTTFSMAASTEKSLSKNSRDSSPERYLGRESAEPKHVMASLAPQYRSITAGSVDQSRENLVLGAAPIGQGGQQPIVPDVGYGAYGGNPYGSAQPPAYGQGQPQGYEQGYGGYSAAYR